MAWENRSLCICASDKFNDNTVPVLVSQTPPPFRSCRSRNPGSRGKSHSGTTTKGFQGSPSGGWCCGSKGFSREDPTLHFRYRVCLLFGFFLLIILIFLLLSRLLHLCDFSTLGKQRAKPPLSTRLGQLNEVAERSVSGRLRERANAAAERDVVIYARKAHLD